MAGQGIWEWLGFRRGLCKISSWTSHGLCNLGQLVTTLNTHGPPHHAVPCTIHPSWLWYSLCFRSGDDGSSLHFSYGLCRLEEPLILWSSHAPSLFIRRHWVGHPFSPATAFPIYSQLPQSPFKLPAWYHPAGLWCSLCFRRDTEASALQLVALNTSKSQKKFFLKYPNMSSTTQRFQLSFPPWHVDSARDTDMKRTDIFGMEVDS